MKNTKNNAAGMRRRLLSALLSLIMIVSMLPAVSVDAEAAAWMEPYLQQLADWGVMRGDSTGNMHPDRPITRAEFVVLVNRAFGYNQTSASIPFRDVKPSDWYYDDINIGYTTGYFNGTSASTASPRDSVTREQATVLLGRNMMLEDQPGASIDFTDSTSLGNFSRGLIRSALTEGIISGYSDGSFRPKTNITRGQMAVILVKAIGNLVNKPGEQSLGGVYGNVTISTSGVVLKDTTIAGNLYITGGLGLGDVTLENVTVLGKIVVSGAGESSGGQNSVILRNVTAPSLLLDNLANNMVSIRAEGNTVIDETFIRTPSYLEDATDDDAGFLKIDVDGEDGTTLAAAGNLKEISTLAPNSTVTIAKGSVQKLNVDETATGSTVSVLESGAVKELNLDVGTNVTGKGDVENLNVNAPGTKVDMLPDTIVVRPDINASINGETMDTTLAAESSADPRLLAGYPKITDIASTSAKGLMRTNKAGTIYWAVTSITDGSVSDADLMKPTNNANILKSGNLKAATSNTDYTANITGLTSDGSYYFSAMLVDAREQHSPVKAVSFSTPDDTAPNFAAGFPYLSQIGSDSAYVTVMTTKTCRLYYALLPKGAAAPTANDFKANAVSGNLGFGSRDMTKNITDTFRVNRDKLEEVEDYVLYLWLTDVDGARSSAVRNMPFTTIDGTPPVFVTTPTVNSIQETSVGMVSSINEAGTIFWVAVAKGAEYPKPMNGQTTQPALSSPEAKLQVSNGMNALKSGKVTATANKDVTINISGLTSETAYDVYYVAQDTAGNFSDKVGKLEIHTLDNNPPTITQEFTSTNDAEGTSPLADTDIRIVFSEAVQDSGSNQQLLALYQKAVDSSTSQDDRNSARETLTSILRSDIQLYDANATPPRLVAERQYGSQNNPTSDDWVIDYSKAEVTAEEGKVVVTFKNGTALNLKSGDKYYFEIRDIADTSTAKNIIKPNPIRLPAFTTVFAQIQFSSSDTSGTIIGIGADGSTTSTTVNFDMSFKAVPVSTGNTGENVVWDLIFRMNIPAKFELYERRGENGAWEKLTATAEINSTDGTMYGAGYTRTFGTGNTPSATNAELLKEMKETRYYGVCFTSLNNVNNPETWSGRIEMEVRAVAGSDRSALHNLANSNMGDGNLAEAMRDGMVEIGSPTPYTMKHTFSDTQIPKFQPEFPKFTPSDVSGSMAIQLNRNSGKIYYVVAPVGRISTTLENGATLTTANWGDLPETIASDDPGDNSSAEYSQIPTSGTIMTPRYTDPSILKGSVNYDGSLSTISLRGLEPKTEYVAYFVLQGSSNNIYSEKPYLFRFKTTEISRPIIELNISNPSVSIKVDSTSTVDYILAVNGNEPGNLRQDMATYALPEHKSKFQANGEYYGKGTGDLIDPDDPDSKLRTYTVLDAMSNSYFKNGSLAGSVFDEYALQTAKDAFAEFIRAQTTASGDVTLSGRDLEIDAGRTRTVDCSSGMTGTTWYTFLVVGKSVAGSGDAFRAIRPVYNRDQAAPMVVQCLSDIQPNQAGTAYKGTLRLVFNEDLYYVVKQGTNQTVTPLEAAEGPTSSAGYRAAGLVFERSAAFTFKAGALETPIYTVSFSFTNAMNGAYINASANLGDKAGNVHTVPLTVRLDATDPDNPKFVIASDWDATT